jgi:hypothetical protein
MMTSNAARILTLVATIWLGGATEGLPSDQLKDLIEKVRTNERLYERIEMRTERIYALSAGTPTIPGTVLRSNETRRYVQQGKMIFRDVKDVGEAVGSGKFERTSTSGFDGRTQRLVEGMVANIAEGPHEVIDAPHIMILPRASEIRFPLSIYLQGGDRLQAYRKFNRWDTTTMYVGEETINGLSCSKVVIESRNRKPPRAVTVRIHLWLAHDRNELPIRVVGYAPNYSDTLPIEEAEVTRFEEVSKGVWFPMAIKVTIYQELLLREGKSVVSNAADLVTKSVDLKPNYPEEFFRKIPIPMGASVYELNDGKIVKSYVEGGQPGPVPR